MQNTTRMTSMDQVIWNLTHDQDLFCIWGLVSLDEPLRDDLIQKTLLYLIKTIPILHSKPTINWFSGYWQLIEKENVDDLIIRIKTLIDEEADAQLKNIFRNPIKAEDKSMIRLISIDGPSKHYFVIQVHHLVVDGEGLKRICVKFAEIYQALYKDKDWTPSGALDPCRSWWQIAKRFNIGHVWLMLKASIINSYDMIIANLKNKTSYTLEGDTRGDKKTEVVIPPYFESIVIEEDVMLKLKAFTKKNQLTVNDVLMTSLSLATMKWNTHRGDQRTWLKFGYTANLRRWWGEPNGTFGNFSVILMYEANHENLQSLSKALTVTKIKMNAIKKWIGLDVFSIMMQLKFIPYFLIRQVSLSLKEKIFRFINHCHAMTNIGIVFEEAGNFGHTTARGYSLLAPTFPDGGIVYTITTYKNVTTIHLGCSENHLKKESARQFLVLWKHTIGNVIDSKKNRIELQLQ